jgi:NTE family protein
MARMPNRAAAKEPSRTALVLSGGGARGAYQAGVLAGLLERGFGSSPLPPFNIYVGSSAGSINAAMLAAYADSFPTGVARLIDVWSTIMAHDVFRTDIGSLGLIGARWAWDLSFGGALRSVQPKSLLDTTPLRTLLARIPLHRINAHIRSGVLRALAVAATDLYTSNGVLFVQGQSKLKSWKRSHWQIERTRIGSNHLMASSAIPIFFPSIRIGGRHFGDGCIRNTAPLSPAINLGAERIVAIGVQGPGLAEHPRKRTAPPTIAQIAGVLLDAVMLDAIEADVEHSARVNRSVLSCHHLHPGNPFRQVDVLWLRPSADIGAIAAKLADRVPPIVRYLLRGLGTDEAITELLSYLLFDPVFTTRLIALGRKDAVAAAPTIERFIAAGASGIARSGSKLSSPRWPATASSGNSTVRARRASSGAGK